MTAEWMTDGRTLGHSIHRSVYWQLRMSTTICCRKQLFVHFTVGYDGQLCKDLCRMSGSVAEWLACWTQAQKGLGSNRSRDAVG